MNKERTVITQELCDHVKALLAGGLTLPNAAKFAKIGEATVGRIKAAGFDAAQYAADTDRRRIQAQNRKADKRIKEWQAEEEKLKKEGRLPTVGGAIDYEATQETMNRQTAPEIPGQIRMWMPEGGGKPEVLIDENKMMRFIAGQVDKILKAMDEDVNKSFIATKTDFILDVMQRQNEKLDKIIDMLGQVLRRADG